MKVIAKSRIVEDGALRKPGDVFEVEKERFRSLGDVVEKAPKETEATEAETDPEKKDEKPDVRKLSAFDKLKNRFGYKKGKVELDLSNLSEIKREDLEAINMDQINDLFAGFEGLDLNPQKQSKGEMIDAVFAYIEQAKKDGPEENGSK